MTEPTEPALREPEQIRQECVAKLLPIDASNLLTAILGCLLGEDWSEPRIEQLIVTDKCLLLRNEGDGGFNQIAVEKEDLIRDIHGIAKTAELDGDELGYRPKISKSELAQNGDLFRKVLETANKNAVE